MMRAPLGHPPEGPAALGAASQTQARWVCPSPCYVPGPDLDWPFGEPAVTARSPGENGTAPARNRARADDLVTQWGERRGSNPRPPGPQPGALPAELHPPWLP